MAWLEGAVGLFFAVWAGVSLVMGKFYNPRAGLFGEFVDRRREPVSYWLLTAVLAGFAVAALWHAVSDWISN